MNKVTPEVLQSWVTEKSGNWKESDLKAKFMTKYKKWVSDEKPQEGYEDLLGSLKKMGIFKMLKMYAEQSDDADGEERQRKRARLENVENDMLVLRQKIDEIHQNQAILEKLQKTVKDLCETVNSSVCADMSHVKDAVKSMKTDITFLKERAECQEAFEE